MQVTGDVRLSWRRVLAQCGPRFLAWDSRQSVESSMSRDFVARVRDYVLRSMSSDRVSDINTDAAEQFISRLPDVFSRCDEDIYDAPFAAEAYAFVHLVERYRRFWDVLEESPAGG